MTNTKMNKIKEIIGVCENINEVDLYYILAYASGIALKSKNTKEKHI